MERKVNELVEESCFANDRGEYPLVRKLMLLLRYTYMYLYETLLCYTNVDWPGRGGGSHIKMTGMLSRCLA